MSRRPLFLRSLSLITACVAAAGLSLGALAQDKPVIKVLLGLPPGGGTDAIARVIVERLPAELGQPAIIESRIGVGGRLAVEAMLAAKPDGLTYMIAPNATPTFQMLVFGHQIKWDILRDAAPVASIATYPLGMAVSLNTGANNVAEFVAWAKRNPGKASFGTPGLGGQNHFLGVQFAKVTGIDMPVAPYKGTPPLMTDLLGGHVPAAVTLMDVMLAQHRAGKVRVIGVFSPKRSPLMPDIPTMLEQGVKVPDADGWTAMWAPRGTPVAELERMQRAVQKILALPEVRDIFTTKLAVQPDFRNAAETFARQKTELAEWEPIVKATGFKAE